MGPDDLIRACLDEMGDSDGIAGAGEVAGTHKSALLGTEGVAAVLGGYAIGAHGADRDRSLELFEALIGAALQDQKGGGRLGAQFLDEAARTIRLLAGTDRLDAPATHDLARAYARAGAEAPAELVQCLAGHMAELRKAGTLPIDPDTEIERMSVVLDLDPHYLHGKLDERIGMLPEEARATFAYEVACREEAAYGRIAMYWLLDESAEVRLGAADGFRERALRGIVDPVSAAMVPLIRNWMPADAGRTLLDEALAEARRRELVAPLPRPEWRRAEVYGSIPDMWGTQMLRVVLQGREEPAIAIPADFPFNPPEPITAHTRFHGFGHVHWGHWLCLYVSSETQWNPSRGMFGFIAQLNEWLRRGARNELDLPEAPLHPPIAYTVASTSVCVNADTPDRGHWPWLGAAVLTETKPGLLEVIDWQPVHAVPNDASFAPTVLLDFELPYEYPRTVEDLLLHLDVKGLSSSRVLAHLMLASERVAQGVPLYVGIGTPSRGIAGDLAQRRQHLTFWEIEAGDVVILRNASLACGISSHYRDRETPEEIQTLIDAVWETLVAWRKSARVRWCHVMENRPEILTRRDEGTPMDWFRGKRVALWGCGAIGGQIAEHLARAGVAELTLYDRARVNPGILVRQNFAKSDVNESKAQALAQRIQSIAPAVTVNAKIENVFSRTLSTTDWDADVDVVIDATASLRVRSKLEARIKDHEPRIPVAGVMLSASAEHAIAVLAPAAYRAGTLDVFRRLGLAAFNRGWLSDWAKAFWTDDAVQGLRQPEPGCSDPTFVASHADVSALSARAMNVIATSLAEGGETASGFLMSQSSDQREHRFRFRPHIRWVAAGLDFRMSAAAWRDMTGWIRAGARERSPQHETGGLLFGAFDETLGIAWITNVSGPPADSSFAAEHFVCGTQGTKELCQDYENRTHGIVRYVGTWHSHPISIAEPSPTDYAGIGAIFATAPEDSAHQLTVIVGHASEEQPEIGAYAFEKRELAAHRTGMGMAIAVRGGVTIPPPVAPFDKTIGLSLSGGGSRAVAFHLGTLRALEDLNLLHEVDIVSGVSGGSVITGLFGYSDAPFADIDRNTVAFLRRGLVRPALKKLFHPARAVPLALNFFAVALPTLVIDTAAAIASFTASLFPAFRPAARAVSRFSWPLRRRYSRTNVVADAMADVVGTQNCDAPTRQGKSIVFNACELRTGTAFRMSNERFSAWRFGWAPASELRVADAVTASAAYPPFLPPFDWVRPFERDGKTMTHRAIVTDGGVFENMGVSVMEPGRDAKFSLISYSPDIIIASDAGAGQFTGEIVPSSWPKRMTQVVSAVMRKVQDATKARLHDYARTGQIDAFVYAALGQIDRRVPLKPANWVDREEVVHYPTDFSVMSQEDIQRLSGRGEAITRALTTQYLLSD